MDNAASETRPSEAASECTAGIETAALRARLGAPSGGAIELAVVTGSGLGGLAEGFETVGAVPYVEVPGLGGAAGVAGHAGWLRLARVAGRLVLFFIGRRHLYEGIDPEQAGAGMRMAAALGVRRVLLTNAAGGLSPALEVGDLMLIRDHLNLMGRDPARGIAGTRAAGGERRAGGFGPDAVVIEGRPGGAPPAREARDAQPASDLRAAPGWRFFPGDYYDPATNDALREAALASGIALREGVYAALLGPNYETRAEVAMLRRLGADAVGMSTVPEVLEARRLGLRVAAISAITNSHAHPSSPPTHDEVLAMGERTAARLGAILKHIIINA